MKPSMDNYQVLSLGNCVMKLCTETILNYSEISCLCTTKASLSAQFRGTITKVENLVTVPAGFHNDETSLTYNETTSLVPHWQSY